MLKSIPPVLPDWLLPFDFLRCTCRRPCRRIHLLSRSHLQDSTSRGVHGLLTSVRRTSLRLFYLFMSSTPVALLFPSFPGVRHTAEHLVTLPKSKWVVFVHRSLFQNYVSDSVDIIVWPPRSYLHPSGLPSIDVHIIRPVLYYHKTWSRRLHPCFPT